MIQILVKSRSPRIELRNRKRVIEK